MKAMWFLPFTYAAGAEGFALFVPYLIGVLAVLYFARARRTIQTLAVIDTPTLELLPDVQPAL
jgi:hypothetical protein